MPPLDFSDIPGKDNNNTLTAVPIGINGPVAQPYQTAPAASTMPAAPTESQYDASRMIGPSGYTMDVEDRATSIYDGLIARGMRASSAAGIAANAIVEGKGRQDAYNKSSGAAGTFQWLGDRKRAYRALYGHDPTEGTLDEHLDFLMMENDGAEATAWGKVQRAADDPVSQAIAFRTHWERPGDEAKESGLAASAARALMRLGLGIGSAQAEPSYLPLAQRDVPAPRGALDFSDVPAAEQPRVGQALPGPLDFSDVPSVGKQEPTSAPLSQQPPPPVVPQPDQTQAVSTAPLTVPLKPVAKVDEFGNLLDGSPLLDSKVAPLPEGNIGDGKPYAQGWKWGLGAPDEPMIFNKTGVAVPGQTTAGAMVNSLRAGVETGFAQAVAAVPRVLAGVGVSTQKGTDQLQVKQADAVRRIDAGEPVPVDQDPIGYGDMTPEQRAKWKAQLGAELTKQSDKPIPLSSMSDLADRILKRSRAAAENVTPVDSKLTDSAAVKFAGMAGGMAPILVGAAFGGLPAVQGVAFLQGYEGMFERAQSKGATPEDAHKAALASGIVSGALMTVPGLQYFGRLVPGLQVPVLGAVIDTALASGSMVGIMQVQTLADNAIAKYGFDPKQSLTEHVGDPEEMALQGLLGGVFHNIPKTRAAIERTVRSTVERSGKLAPAMRDYLENGPPDAESDPVMRARAYREQREAENREVAAWEAAGGRRELLRLTGPETPRPAEPPAAEATPAPTPPPAARPAEAPPAAPAAPSGMPYLDAMGNGFGMPPPPVRTVAPTPETPRNPLLPAPPPPRARGKAPLPAGVPILQGYSPGAPPAPPPQVIALPSGAVSDQPTSEEDRGRNGETGDIRTAGYDRDPDDALAGRIDHLREQVARGDLAPEDLKELNGRIGTFQQFRDAREAAGLPPDLLAKVRQLRTDDLVTGTTRRGRTVTGRLEGWGPDNVGIVDANGIAHTVQVNQISDVRRVGGTPEMPANPAQPSAEPSPTGAYVMLNPAEIGVDAPRFQFKEAGDRGVTGALGGVEKWEPSLANPITVWQDTNGKKWVVNGHQRLDLAQRAQKGGQDVQMPAQVYREADGYTPEYMRVLGAYQNMAEGSGTAVDAAKILRSNFPDKAALPGLPPRSAIVQQGNALAKLGDQAFGMVVNGAVPPAYAAHVGDLIADPAEQVGALAILARAEPVNSEQARIMVQDIRDAGFLKGKTEADLFGGQSFAQGLFPERAKVLDHSMRTLRGVKKVFSAAVQGEGTLTEAGNQMSTSANTKGMTENERLLETIRTDGTKRGPLSDALNEAAREVADGKPVSGAASRFLSKARAIVRGGPVAGVQPGGAPGGNEPAAQPPAVTSFTTAKGSTYTVHEDGTTTRDKSYHPEHGVKDQGPQPRSQATVYVTPEQADALSLFQTQDGGKMAIDRLPDGRIGVKYLDGKDAGRFERRTVLMPQTAPAVGLLPVEVWKGGTRVHFGNAITQMGAPAPAVDLLGNPIDGPRGPRTAEPTISNDPNQITIPGMRPSAVQAQAASDAKGPRSGQEKANEGLFAPPEIEQPSLPTPAQPPPTSSEAAPPPAHLSLDPEVWWDKGLTTAGRKLVMDAAGLKRVPKIKWKYLSEAERTKLLAKRSAGTDVAAAPAPKPEQPQPEPEQPQAEKSGEPPPDFGADNKTFTRDAYEKAKARMREKASRMNSGFDPQMMLDGFTMAGFHIEGGARRFVDYAKRMIADLGEGVRPMLGHFYNSVRDYPGFDNRGMDRANVVRDIDLNDPRLSPKVETEAPNGLQGPVPGQNDSGRPEDVHGPSEVGETRPASPGAIEESASNAGGPVEPGAEGFGGTGVEPAGASGGGGGRPGEHDGLPGPITEPDAGTPGGSRPPDSWVVGQNHRIEPGSLEEARGPTVKARDNLAAVELAQALTADKRPASKEEQGVLAKYVGWGGLSGVFPNPKTGAFGKGLEKVGARLREILSPAEYEAAASSTQNAHYTAEHVIRSMWGTVERMGFKGGTVFEPGMGVGHFLGLMPPDIAGKSSYQGIEKDNTTAMIAALLYPQSGVRQADYVETPMPDNHFDLVIGNPPFADVVIHGDPKYTARNFMLHDYFFAKSLDSVRPGGLMAFVTSAGTMNKMEPAAREYLAERSEFVGGVRLPSSAFRQNAGTDVTTDVLFFKKRPARVPIGEVPEHETWTGTSPRELPDAADSTQTGLVNNYFSAHPEMVLGREGFFDKLYKGRYAVHQEPILNADGKRDAEAERAVLQTQFREALDRLPSDIMTAPPTPEERAALDFASGQVKDGSFYINPKGELMQYRSGAGQAVKQRGNKGGGFTAEELARIRHLVPIRDALRDVFRADLAENAADAAAARVALNKHYDTFVAKFGPINKAEFQYRRPTSVQAEAARLEAREEARDIGQFWDDGDFDPSAMIAAGKTNTEIAKARQALKDRIEKAGKVFDEGSFDPDDMPDTKIEKRPNIKPFMGDPESYRMRSIEHYNDDTGKAVKKRIFRESVLTREEEPQINSAGDGLMWSLNKFGRMDLDQIAGKMGKSKDAIIAELGDKVFRVPGTTDSYQSDAEYLSGDVVAKLDEARAMLQNDPDMERNVRALEAALPPPLPPGEITMLLGMPWMPRSLMQDFASDHLRLGTIKVVHIPAAGTWKVEDVGGRNADRSGAITWGTGHRKAVELLSDAMNRTPPRITFRDREGKTHFMPVETQEAVEKMNAINEEFQNWLEREPDRIKTLAQTYNDALNRTVLRKFDGSYLTTPGISSEWRWRPHQTRVVGRIIQTGNTYMAHAVGAGKTSAMIGAGMEMRRLGLVKKPMYVVPNHMLGQFTKEFYEQYPTARIAVADEARFHTDVRRQFMSDVAQDDLDAVIITHSSFQKIPISREFEAGLIQEELDRLAEALEGLSSQEDRITIKALKNMQDKLRQKLLKANTKDKDETNTFEEMGVDFLFVDEAHMFRKLSLATKQGNLKGITATGSGMAWDLFTKIRRLEANTPGRAAVLASGTPVTNTMGELYNLSRYLQTPALKTRGIDHFDSWSQMFGTTKTELEAQPDGSLKPQTRFASFVNMPELYKMVGEIMDIVTPHQLAQYVTRPTLAGGERKLHIAPFTEQLADYQAMLGARMQAIALRKGPPQPGDDILLSVINDGRHAAIDPRFVMRGPADPLSKLNMMIDNVHRIWQETKQTQFYHPRDGYKDKAHVGPATQMIFMNLGVNGRGPQNFSGYTWIRSALRAKGIPANEIAIIGDYKGTVARQALFNDMNTGKVRVLLGSVQKMGTGVNAQRLLIALHNQDPLWYPADDEQRVGRMLRQGNMNPEVQVHDYTTMDTYDRVMWQMMGRKGRFIEQFFRGDPELRHMEDLGEAGMFEQASAMTTSDPRVFRLTEMKQDLQAAQRRASAYEGRQYDLANQKEQQERWVRFYDKQIANSDLDIAQRQDTRGDKFRMRVGDKTYTTRKEAAEALSRDMLAATNGLGADKSMVIGEIGGFPLVAERGKKATSEVNFYLRLNGGQERGVNGQIHDAEWSAGLIRSAEAGLRTFDDDRLNSEARRDDALKQIPLLQKALAEPFKGAADIQRLRAEVRKLEDEMSGKGRPPGDYWPKETPDWITPAMLNHEHMRDASVAWVHNDMALIRSVNPQDAVLFTPVKRGVGLRGADVDYDPPGGWPGSFPTAAELVILRAAKKEAIASYFEHADLQEPPDRDVAQSAIERPRREMDEPGLGVAPRGALNRTPGNVKRGAAAIINRLRLDTNLTRAANRKDGRRNTPTLTPDQQREIEDFINFLGDHMVSDVGLSIRQGPFGRQGQFGFGARVVTLFKEAIQSGDASRTMVHELWHAMEDALPAADRVALTREYQRARAAWLKGKDWAQAFVEPQGLKAKLTGIPAQVWLSRFYDKASDVDKLRLDTHYVRRGKSERGEPTVSLRWTSETYRFHNRSEYFAETMADRHFQESDIQNAKARSIWAHLKDIWRRMVNGVKRMFGRDQTGRIYEGFGRGEYDTRDNMGPLATDPAFSAIERKEPGKISEIVKTEPGMPSYLYSFPGMLFDPKMWKGLVGPLAPTARKLGEHLRDLEQSIHMTLAPMGVGGELGSHRAMAWSADFANALRGVQFRFGELDKEIERKFNPAEREQMARALDAQSVFEQQVRDMPPNDQPAARVAFDATRMGLAGLELEKVQTLELLDRISTATWEAMRAREMVSPRARALPYYYPRQIVSWTEAAGFSKIGRRAGSGQGIKPVGGNLTTKGPMRRKYLTPEETEAAARAELGPDVHIVRDIRSLVQRLAYSHQAIAGVDLMDKVHEVGRLTGVNLVVRGDIPGLLEPGDYFTIADHPAFRRFVGNGWQAIHVANEFKGPFNAILTQPSPTWYRGAQLFKGAVMSAIMYSPFIHLAVEVGRALPVMPHKFLPSVVKKGNNALGLPLIGTGHTLTLRVIRDGSTVRKDPAYMDQAIKDGIAPLGRSGWRHDPVTISQEAMTVERGRMARIVLGARDAIAEGGRKIGGDMLHDILQHPHQVLLWDQVFNLQMGIYDYLRAKWIKKGFDPETAGTMAAHIANRYAGALPPEHLSKGANMAANLLLFSRSFTLGNLAVMKDMFKGASPQVLARIEQMIGTDRTYSPEDATLRHPLTLLKDTAWGGSAQSTLKRKAISAFVIDIAMFYMANALLQGGIQALRDGLDKTGEEWEEKAMFALEEAAQGSPMALFGLLPQEWNEPGKQDRVFLGLDDNGRGIYARLPTGKVGEEFVGWFSKFGTMLVNKSNPPVRAIVEAMFGQDSLGRQIYPPSPQSVSDRLEIAGLAAAHIAKSLVPLSTLEGVGEMFQHHVMGKKSTADPGVTALKVLGPLTGIMQISSGYPGGPVMGELHRLTERQRFYLNKAMPDIRSKIVNGDEDGARARMDALGAPVSFQNYVMKQVANPSFISKSKQRAADSAPPEVRERLRFHQRGKDAE